MKPPIPKNKLFLAYAEAALPVKKITRDSVALWEAVANLKIAGKSGVNVDDAKVALQRAMIDALDGTDHQTVMDEIAKAQTKSEVKVDRVFTVTREGRTVAKFARGSLLNKPRSPITMAIVETVLNIQGRTERAPTRQEIIKALETIKDGGIDDSELSRQLTRLGWNDLLS